MKITLKLSKEESEGFNNVFDMLKPQGVSNDQFVKFIFLKGMETFQVEAKARVKKFEEDHPEEFAKMIAEAKASDESSIEPVETEDPKVEIIKD